MAAPLRESEEPSPGFDARILQAARTQAQIEHEGSVGQVIEVTGTVRPLGVEAARIDAHGPVKARRTPRERPAWMKRAAIGGSLAAAAMLALVVGNTLETRRNAERVAAARSDDYQIRVGQPPETAVGSALREATKPATPSGEPAPVPANNVAGDSSGSRADSTPPRPAESSKDLRRRGAGSGGDAPGIEEQLARGKQPAAPVAKEKKSEARQQDNTVAMDGDALEALSEPVPPVKAAAPPSSAAAQGGVVAAAPHQAPARLPQSAQPPGASVEASSGATASSLPAQAPMASAQAERQATPASLEAGAQEARHAANYLQAASLYREAATLRRRENDPSAAAWNLAHAVECLAAIGRFDEARQVRDEMVRLFPAETGPQSAARRVLREVEPSPAAR